MRNVCIMMALLILPLLQRPAYGEDIYENQLNRGITNSDVYALRLMSQAEEDPSKAKDMIAKAIKASPSLPGVYFKASKNAFAFSAENIFESIDYLVEGVNAYSKNFWWTFTLLGGLFLSLVSSFVMTVIIIVLIRLRSDLPLFSHDVAEAPVKAGLLVLLVLLALASPLLFLAGTLTLLGLHMRKTDKIVVNAFLLLILLSPWLFKTAGMFINAPASGKARAIVQVNESRGNAYALSVLNREADYPARFSYALSLKREGSYQAAADIFSSLIQVQKDPRAYVNLGNCLLGLNRMDEAAEQYTQSLNVRPIASAYYNLSQISRDLLEFNKGDEYFVAALGLDRIAVAGYRAIYARHPNRLVADETLSRSELWQYFKEHFGRSSSYYLSLVPIPALSFAALGLAAGFFWLGRNLKHTAYRCRKCGVILCSLCEKRMMWGRMCPQCYGSFVKLEETDVRERVARLLDIYEKQNRRRGIMKMLSFVLPGGAFIYGGKILIGTLMLWPFLFFLMIPVMNGIITMGDAITAHSFFNILALLGALIIHVFAYGITKRRIARGWL